MPCRSIPDRRDWFRVAAICLLFVGGRLAIVGAEQPATDPTVELTIDYGDGVQKRFVGLPHKSGATLLDALEAARRHPRGIQFEYRGKADTAFLTKIDDLVNEGRGRNWTYRVNDKPGDRSFAIYKLEAGDRVVWKYGVYKESP